MVHAAYLSSSRRRTTSYRCCRPDTTAWLYCVLLALTGGVGMRSEWRGGGSPPSEGLQGARPGGGAEERGAGVEHHVDGDAPQHLAQAALVGEALEEAARLDGPQDLGRDPAPHEHAADGHRLQREIPGLGAVDRDEERERLDADRVRLGEG